MPARSAPSSRPASRVTAPKRSLGGTPRATRVATRRSAACSSASRLTSARAAEFEIAVATSSVNAPTLDSVSAGIGWSAFERTTIAPQRLPSATIGTPIAERMPRSRSMAASTPEARS